MNKKQTKSNSSKKQNVSEVTGELTIQLDKSGLEFKIMQNREILGTLIVSRGSLSWKPKNAKKKIQKQWKQFADMMEIQ